MVHKDKIVQELELVYEGVFDLKELLHLIKDLFKRYNYDFEEKVYESKPKGDLKNNKIKWSFNRKLDDYNKAVVNVELELSDCKEGYADSTKVLDGKLKIKFWAEMDRDYGEQWKKLPTKKFFRAIYDKYVVSQKQRKVDNSVKDLVEGLRNEIKQYLKL